MGFIADIFLGLKDFLWGSAKGVANGPYSWASWVFPITTLVGIGAGLATGNAAVLLGIAVGGPLLVGAVGGLVGLVTGGLSELWSGLRERSNNRAADNAERERVRAAEAEREAARARAVAPAAVPVKPAKTSAREDVPTTEIMAPGSTPARLAEAGPQAGRTA